MTNLSVARSAPPAAVTPATSGIAPEASLAGRIAAEIESGKVELPVLPEAAVRVREIVGAGGSARELVSVIEREPSLAAAILRYSNSVAYAGLREITDLHQAVMRLGFSAVEQTVIALSARNVFQATDKADEQIYRALWTHSIATALAARRLAPRASDFNPEAVFLSGLLHDIGKVVVLRCAALMRRRDPARFTFERSTLVEFLDALHCNAGDRLCRAWNLPAEIREVVKRHHDAALDAPGDALVAIVQLANGVATKIGASLEPDPHVSLLDLSGAALLRLDDVKLAALLVDVEDDVARMEEGF